MTEEKNYDPTSQVVRIIAAGKADRWDIQWLNGVGGKSMSQYDRHTPELNASLKNLFGDEYKNEGVWGLPDYLKWSLIIGEILDTRAEFLYRREKIYRNYGMSPHRPEARAIVEYVNRIGNAYGTLKGQPYSFKVVVEWYRDKSVLLEVEFPIGEGAELISLYLFQGCEHKFNHVNGGRCYTISTCEKCGYRYDIDSGD